MQEGSRARLLAASARVPEHTIYRAFPGVTVVLNVATGRYYGLNDSGARMLTALEQAGSVAGAIERLAETYDRSAAEIETELVELCAEFEAHGLVVLGGEDDG